jgi:hypothetical protein
MSNPTQPAIPRAPRARAKLEQAEKALEELSGEVALLALGAAEGAPGAEKALVAHRAKVEAAERQAGELRAAVVLAEKLDRQTTATAAATMRAEQLVEFRKQMSSRETAMATIMKLAAEMAAAYGRYSEATLAAMIAVPTGASVPMMAIGPNGLYGPAFGPCDRLITAELWRLAPPRADGAGRFVLPFAKPLLSLSPGNPAELPPGVDEMRAANEAILTDIEKQIATLDQREMAAASATKEAA